VWAYELPTGPGAPALEAGVVLVASAAASAAADEKAAGGSSSNNSPDWFSRAVVLLVGIHPAAGAVGVVLNKPSGMRLRDVRLGGAGAAAAGGNNNKQQQPSSPSSSSSPSAPSPPPPSTPQQQPTPTPTPQHPQHALVASVFGGRRLALGGPVHGDTLTALHRYAGLQGAREVGAGTGVYVGGLAAAAGLVRAGLASPGEFRLALGLAGWAAGQLEDEVSRGVWRVAVASADALLPPPPPMATAGGAGAGAAPVASDAAAAVTDDDSSYACGVPDRALWDSLQALLGTVEEEEDEEEGGRQQEGEGGGGGSSRRRSRGGDGDGNGSGSGDSLSSCYDGCLGSLYDQGMGGGEAW
jgi:putative AlgH/UPF0301 family transcriptional regulator